MPLAGVVTQQPHERPKPLPQESVSPTAQAGVTPASQPITSQSERCATYCSTGLYYGMQGTAFWDYGKFIRECLGEDHRQEIEESRCFGEEQGWKNKGIRA